jgi:histidinol-phosphate phosphatase family protein
MPRPAVFLDRDGVINVNRPDYVKSWAEVQFLPGVFRALARLAQTPFAIIVVSNQSPIGRGLLAPEVAEEINRRIRAMVVAHGGRIDAVYICPHRPDEGCACRKPQPGLILRAAEEHDLDLSASYLVGDAQSDVEAALAAGVHPILVLTGRGRAHLPRLSPGLRAACTVVEDLPAAVDWILRAAGLDRREA